MAAFTLLEMIIAMCIGAIIISMAYELLLTLKDEWTVIKHRQDEMTSVAFFKETFERDIDDAKYIRTNDERNIYVVSEKDTIDYHFDTTIVRLQKNRVDTFLMSIRGLDITYVPEYADSGVVNKLTFSIVKPYTLESIKFYKHYTAADMLVFGINKR